MARAARRMGDARSVRLRHPPSAHLPLRRSHLDRQRLPSPREGGEKVPEGRMRGFASTTTALASPESEPVIRPRWRSATFSPPSRGEGRMQHAALPSERDMVGFAITARPFARRTRSPARRSRDRCSPWRCGPSPSARVRPSGSRASPRRSRPPAGRTAAVSRCRRSSAIAWQPEQDIAPKGPSGEAASAAPPDSPINSRPIQRPPRTYAFFRS